MSLSDRQASRKVPAGPRIAIAIDIYDWHARDFSAALARAGAIAVPVRLAQCGFDTRRPHGLIIPGFGRDLPDAVLVRAIGSGTFESVTLRLDVLHSLAALGIPVLNSARCIEICVDKAAASFLLGQKRIPAPPTWTLQSAEAARQVVRREAARGPLVLKPLFGAQGFGLKLVRHEEDLPSFEEVEGVYYLQRFVGVDNHGFRDIRVLVSRRAVIGAMIRHSKHWITNLKLGARPQWHEPDEKMCDLALRTAAAVGAEFAGVDLIYDADHTLHVLEVNSMPGWRGLQQVAPFSIAGRLATDVLNQLNWPRARAQI